MNKINLFDWFIDFLVIWGVIALMIHVNKNEPAKLKQEAIERGFAEYKIVGENKVEFTWKEKQ